MSSFYAITGMFWMKYVLGKKKKITGCPMLYQLEEAEDRSQKCTAKEKWVYAVCQFAYKFFIECTVAIWSQTYGSAVQVEDLTIAKWLSISSITEYILKCSTWYWICIMMVKNVAFYNAKTNLLTVCSLPKVISVSDCRKYQLPAHKQE